MPATVDPNFSTPIQEKSASRGDYPKKLWLHALLFFATCATTFFAGGLAATEKGQWFSPISGLMYSTAIMGILLLHEMGHFIAARHHRVDASLPYFLPVPLPPIGTFGAVIRMHRPPRTRAALLDIGSAGPLTGVVASVLVCYLGLQWSEVRPLSELGKHGWMEGNSLLYLLLKHITHPELGPTTDVILHPVAWAGWLGLLVTSINLIPAGQLDGGHVLYALVGPSRHQKLSQWIHVAVFVMGMVGLICNLSLQFSPVLKVLKTAGLDHVFLRGSGMLVWLVWAVLLRFVGGKHPPIDDTGTPLSTGRRVVGFLTLGLVVLTFTPVVGSDLSP